MSTLYNKSLFGQHQAGRGGPFFLDLAGEVMPEKPVVVEDGLDTGWAGRAVGNQHNIDLK